MKARMPAGYGRPDPNAMMRQVQKMQEALKAKTEELEGREFTGTASGEMVSVTMTGKHQVTAVKIKPEAVDPDDIEMLEDLVAAAVNDAIRQVDETTESEMGYYHRDAANKDAFTEDGFFRTGDAGYIKDGELFLTDRTDRRAHV